MTQHMINIGALTPPPPEAHAVPVPAGYAVSFGNRVRLADNVPDVIGVILSLHNAGLLEWAQSKAYDAFWTYLKAVTPIWKRDPEDQAVRVQVNDSVTGLPIARVTIPRPVDFDDVQVKFRNTIEENASEQSVSVRLRKKKLV